MTYPSSDFLNIGEETVEIVETAQNTAGHFITLRRVVQPASVLPQPSVYAHCDVIIDVLCGTLTYALGGETGQIRPGGRIIFPGGVLHTYGNLSVSEELVYFQVFAPCLSITLTNQTPFHLVNSGKGLQKTVAMLFTRLSNLCFTNGRKF